MTVADAVAAVAVHGNYCAGGADFAVADERVLPNCGVADFAVADGDTDGVAVVGAVGSVAVALDASSIVAVGPDSRNGRQALRSDLKFAAARGPSNTQYFHPPLCARWSNNRTWSRHRLENVWLNMLRVLIAAPTDRKSR